MKYTYKSVANVYEVTSQCSTCSKNGLSKQTIVHNNDIVTNPFKTHDEAMPVGWYSSPLGIYCSKECYLKSKEN